MCLCHGVCACGEIRVIVDLRPIGSCVGYVVVTVDVQ